MRLFSYIVVSDSGFAPNPFWGWCTLAACKPRIRRTARIGDRVVGLSPKATGHRLVYAMEVTDQLPIGAYFDDTRFADKKPDMTSPARIRKRGDNIYEPGPEPGTYRQLPSLHSNKDGTEDPRHVRRDLSGLNVLISDRFWYFGHAGPQLPDAFDMLKVGIGHKCKFPPELVDEFVAYIEQFPLGVNGRPAKWDPSDESWMGLPG